MQATLLAACSEQLQDRYVSRANLLLGVSLLKQDRETEARRAFINATLIGGANAQAAQWLSYMEAQPASENELRRVRGPCYGSEGKKESLDDEPVAKTQTAVAEPAVAETSVDDSQPVIVKTVLDMRFFYSSHSESIAELLPEVKALAARLNVSLVKASGNANGPLHLLSLPGEELRLAIPLRGSAQARGRYRIYNAEAFKCASMTLDATAEEPLAAVAEFAEKVEASGHRLTSEYRLLMNQGKTPTFELQLGIE